MRGPDQKSEPLKEAYSFGNSTLFLTPEGGIKKAVPLQDDFVNAPAEEVFAVVKSRSLSSHSEPRKEQVNLELERHIQHKYSNTVRFTSSKQQARQSTSNITIPTIHQFPVVGSVCPSCCQSTTSGT